MEYKHFTPGPWGISLIKFDGEVILAPAYDKSRSNDVICTSILNPYDAQLIKCAPRMYELLKHISELIDTNPEEIINLKESIEKLLNYINRERIKQ
mgnify:CR=1 FL=1